MANRTGKAVRKYLQHYSEPNSDCLLPLQPHLGVIDQAVVIPAFKESAQCVERMLDLPSFGNTLTILVLNGPETLSESEKRDTLRPLHFLQQATQPVAMAEPGLWLFKAPLFKTPNTKQSEPGHQVLCVDLIQQRPWQQFGVGFARKLGMDMALWLYHHGILQHPMVRSSDADVIWPTHYLQPLHTTSSTSAVIYPFQHGLVENDVQSNAAAIYDAWLRYYVEGLAWAGSPWAFHTIGSILAIHLEHYANNRGFPKREAGEDFYLLNKLAKTGTVTTLHQPRLTLSNRASNRTPFGTGISIHKMQTTSLEAWPFYHPAIFEQLRFWYQHKPEHFGKTTLRLPEAAAPLAEGLKALGLEKQLMHCIKNQCNETQFQTQMNNKLDAANTRKLVHWLRDNAFASINYNELITQINQQSVPFLKPEHTLNGPWDLAHFLYEQQMKSVDIQH